MSLSQAAAAALAAFPPRGSIALLPAEATGGGRPAMDRLIAQDYIIDSMLYFDGDRVESAVRLASGADRALWTQQALLLSDTKCISADERRCVPLCNLLPVLRL